MPPFSGNPATVSPPPSPSSLLDFPAKPLATQDADNDNMMHDDMRKQTSLSVRFENVVALHWIQSVSYEDRQHYYMARRDYDSIKRDCADAVAKAKEEDAAVNDVETRGLESSLLTGEKFLKAYLHRRGALRAVFKEQVFQKETGYNAPEHIAGAYAVFSRKSADQARTLAEKDALEMHQSD